tara:strand:- start:6680 stop:7495 length:816 start_codon:yes stop_codon:yes gene_type:complete
MKSQENVALNIRYKFIHVRDSENIEEPFEEMVILSVADKSSRYCSERRYNEVNKTESNKSQTTNKIQNSGSVQIVSGGPLLLVNNSGPLMKEEIIKNFEEQKLSIYTSLGFKSFQIETPIPKIQWQIEKEKKAIGDIQCQKAIGTYAGRTYTAWFAPSLPYNDGPWKLSGLPGLILEAKDEKNEVMFVFKELSKTPKKQNERVVSFNKSKYHQPINLKSYNNLKTAFETDPVGVSRAQVNNAKLAISNVSGNAEGNAASLKIKDYNPLELK